MAEGPYDCDVIVAGGGASGMMTAITAAKRGRRVILLERNERLGKKLFITGKGRCNLTNACPEPDIYRHIMTNDKFMYSSIKRYTNSDVMDFFESAGLKLKTERGGRVFPESDHSSDVIRTLENKLLELGVGIRLHTRVKSLVIKDNVCKGVVAENGDGSKVRFDSESTIITTGGLSYPSTGSDGDGYRFAGEAGMEIISTDPGLVPLEKRGDICKRLQGLSLKNASIAVSGSRGFIYKSDDVGEMLFTHFGVSGPLILTASSQIDPDAYGGGLKLHIDLKPALETEELDRRLQRDFKEYSNREFKNSLEKLLPSKLIPVMVEVSGIDPYKKVNLITREERRRLTDLLKDFTLEIKGPRGFDEAMVTKGGVSVKEIDPKTFESKKVKGLYFAGEVI
ncbi:MAG: NAD(P)/FAD-dependent oxidoreductase, partial [Lachnospiraceae bacterium]|nr:NAD(P)/FAD-dependent oxidoreductase [Lachnospiraceae bacterium]